MRTLEFSLVDFILFYFILSFNFFYLLPDKLELAIRYKPKQYNDIKF